MEISLSLSSGGGGGAGEGRTQGNSHNRPEEKFDISGERLAVLAKGQVHSCGHS